MKRDASALITVLIAVATSLILLRVRLYAQVYHQKKPASTADTAGNAYNFLIASGFLCDPPNPDICPAVARDSTGESMEISGAGAIGLASRSVTAAGAFTLKNTNGYIITTGVWGATRLVSFVSYGLAPGVLQHDYPQLNAPGVLPMGKVPAPVAALMNGPVAAGGLAIFGIRLTPNAGNPKDAVLQINWAKGKVPEGEQSDGVRLTVAGGLAFDQQVSGRTALLLQRPGLAVSWK